MDLKELREIRKYAIIALFSDDYFLDKFVLKGGNALDIVYHLSSRPSIDIDISMESDFDLNSIDECKKRLENSFVKTFFERGYILFDFDFVKKPKQLRENQPDFWGGYEITFKLSPKDVYASYSSNSQLQRSTSLPLGEGGKKSFKVDISKHEYCKDKTDTQLDDYTIFVYTPEMIVIEKLRSICQQMQRRRIYRESYYLHR